MSRHDPTSLIEILFDNGFDLRKRRVYLQGELGVDCVEQDVVRGLQYLDKTTGKIELWICSPGGDVSQMFAIYDVVRSLTNEVTTIGFGEIASAACLLLVAGDKRACTPNAYFMSHQDHWKMEGDTELHRAQVAISDRQAKRWNQLMASRTKHTAQWWGRQTKERRELWFDAQQMLKHGVIDEIWPEVNP